MVLGCCLTLGGMPKAKKSKKAAKRAPQKKTAKTVSRRGRKPSHPGGPQKTNKAFAQYSFFMPHTMKVKLEAMSKKTGQPQTVLVLKGIAKVVGA